jgi:hypothetical protein
VQPNESNRRMRSGSVAPRMRDPMDMCLVGYAIRLEPFFFASCGRILVAVLKEKAKGRKCEILKIGVRKPSVKKRIAAHTSPKRLIRSKIRAPNGFGWLTNPKKAAYNRAYYRTTKKACYIATAVYGDSDAWQVERLREYRDKVLADHLLGLIFIFLYYELSPHFVILFKDARPLNDFVRKLLDAIVHDISS